MWLKVGFYDISINIETAKSFKNSEKVQKVYKQNKSNSSF